MQFTDQLGRSIHLATLPQRIVSLVPSQTELLFHLGLGDRVVGITKFCLHPAEALATKIKIGGTKKLDLDAIRLLAPDLIIGNKEENERRQVEALMHEYPVWMSDIADLSHALQMIKGVGEITGTLNDANTLAMEISTQFKSIASHQYLRTAYFIWRKPYMVAAQGTFINNMLSQCCLVNVFADEVRYPEIDVAHLRHANPQVILLSSEPYPFGEKHIAELQAICPNASIKLVDGEMFSWYGSRLLQAPAYFNILLKELS